MTRNKHFMGLDQMITWILLRYPDRELSLQDLYRHFNHTLGMKVPESSIRSRMNTGTLEGRYVRTDAGWYAIDENFLEEARRVLDFGARVPRDDAEFGPWLADLLDSTGAPAGATLRGRMVRLTDQLQGRA